MSEEAGQVRPDVPSGSEHAKVLQEVLEDQARRRSAQTVGVEESRRSAETPFFVQVSLLVTGTLFFYLLFFSPAWISAPTAPAPVSQEKVEESLRVAIYMTAKQVQAFQDQTGRLPDDLREVGEAREGLEYHRVDARTYRLVASRGEQTVLYDSTQSLEDFVGAAVERFFGTMRGTS